MAFPVMPSLPLELVSDIFSWVVRPVLDRHGRAIHTPYITMEDNMPWACRLYATDSDLPWNKAVTVSQVCKTWRRLALGVPELWSYLIDPRHEHLDEILARSAGYAPIVLQVQDWPIEQIKSALMLALPKLHELVVYSCDEELLEGAFSPEDRAGLGVLLANAPSLRFVSFAYSDADRVYHPKHSSSLTALLSTSAPALQVLHLNQCYFPMQSTPHPGFHSLVVLYIELVYRDSDPYSHALIALSAAPNLEELHLSHDAWDGGDQVNSVLDAYYMQSRYITLNKLRALVLRCDIDACLGLLRIISTPSLRVQKYALNAMNTLDGWVDSIQELATRIGLTQGAGEDTEPYLSAAFAFFRNVIHLTCRPSLDLPQEHDPDLASKTERDITLSLRHSERSPAHVSEAFMTSIYIGSLKNVKIYQNLNNNTSFPFSFDTVPPLLDSRSFYSSQRNLTSLELDIWACSDALRVLAVFDPLTNSVLLPELISVTFKRFYEESRDKELSVLFEDEEHDESWRDGLGHCIEFTDMRRFLVFRAHQGFPVKTVTFDQVNLDWDLDALRREFSGTEFRWLQSDSGDE